MKPAHCHTSDTDRSQDMATTQDARPRRSNAHFKHEPLVGQHLVTPRLRFSDNRHLDGFGKQTSDYVHAILDDHSSWAFVAPPAGITLHSNARWRHIGSVVRVLA